MSIKALSKILPPPKSPVEAPRESQWLAVERHLGTRLPTDYKQLVGTYGTGKIDDFIWLANPFSKSMPWFSWVCRTLGGLSAVRQSGGKKAVPHAIFPEPSGLLPWASSENGNVFYFRTAGEPDEWPTVVIEARGPRFDEVDDGATAFLAALLAKKHVSPVLPNSFPPNKHSFAVLVDERKTSISIAFDARPFADRVAVLQRQLGKAKIKQAFVGEARVTIPGTSIAITYRDYDEDDDDGKTGAELFAVYASAEENEVRRIVRDAARDAGWTLGEIVDFQSKRPTWSGGA